MYHVTVDAGESSRKDVRQVAAICSVIDLIKMIDTAGHEVGCSI